jgi:hypothetical protein
MALILTAVLTNQLKEKEDKRTTHCRMTSGPHILHILTFGSVY